MRLTTFLLFGSIGLTACGSTAGTGTTSTGGTGGGTPGPMPLTAPSEQWTFVPFDNAFCANGNTTGIGVNLSTKSTRVLIYLEGGGACWSDLTCYTLQTASYFTSGYGPTDFMTESTDKTYLALPGGFFDRTAAANPFKDYSYIYVPYCTGDIHAGNNPAMMYNTATAKHVGFANMTAYLERIVPTFPNADRVILAGSSAGGFGAAYNWWQTQKAFGTTRVDLIDDSGTPMPADIESQGFGEANERMAWNLAATLPPGCTGCTQTLDALLGFYQQQFPTHRASLLTYIQDSTLPTYFGISEAAFEQGLMEDLSMFFTPGTGFNYFSVNAMGHVLWFSPTLTATTGGATLQQFVTQQVTDDKSWTSVHP